MMGKCGKEEQRKKGENRVKTAVRVLFKFVFCLLNGRNLTFFFFFDGYQKKRKCRYRRSAAKGTQFPEKSTRFPEKPTRFPEKPT